MITVLHAQKLFLMFRATLTLTAWQTRLLHEKQHTPMKTPDGKQDQEKQRQKQAERAAQERQERDLDGVGERRSKEVIHCCIKTQVPELRGVE